MNADGFAIRSIWRIPMCRGSLRLLRSSLRSPNPTPSARAHSDGLRYAQPYDTIGIRQPCRFWVGIVKTIVAHGTWATKPERLANTRCGVAREAGVVDTRVFAQFAYAAGICVQSLSPAAAPGRGPPISPNSRMANGHLRSMQRAHIILQGERQ